MVVVIVTSSSLKLNRFHIAVSVYFVPGTYYVRNIEYSLMCKFLSICYVKCTTSNISENGDMNFFISCGSKMAVLMKFETYD